MLCLSSNRPFRVAQRKYKGVQSPGADEAAGDRGYMGRRRAISRGGPFRRKWGPVSPPAPTLPLAEQPGQHRLWRPVPAETFRPRSVPSRFCVSRRFGKFRYAVRSVRRPSVPPRVLPPKGLGPALDVSLESGFGSFRLSPLRASRFFLVASYRPLCCRFSVLANFKLLHRGGSGWLRASRFRSAAFPATQARWQAPPSRARRFSLWISRISGIESRRRPVCL